MNPVKVWVCFQTGKTSTKGPVCVQGTPHPDCGPRNIWK